MIARGLWKVRFRSANRKPQTANHKPQTAHATRKPPTANSNCYRHPLTPPSGKRAVRVKEVSQLEDSLRAERSSADNDVTASKARVIELQAAVQVRGCWAINAHCVDILSAEAWAKACGAACAGAAAGARAWQHGAAV